MAPKESARSVLRSATASYHDRVDRSFSTADLADRAAYGRFLMAQAAAHIAVEQALTDAGAAAILPDWSERCRADLLRADLAALDLTPPAAIEARAFDGAEAVLGGAYVLEGSRLGGRLLQRSVPPEFPCSFLGAGDSAAWRRLLALLDDHLDDDPKRQIAIQAAADVFVLFERSAQRFLKV